MNQCKYCHNLVNYSLFDRIYFYGCKRYFIYNMCFECNHLFERMFQLVKDDDLRIADEEFDEILQPF